MNEVQLTWFDLAKKTLKFLREYDKEHGEYYAYYLDQTKDGAKVLADCMQKADRTFMWKGVPDAK